MLQRFTEWSVSRVSWFGAVVFGAGLIAMLFVGSSSDRTGEHRWHFAIPQLAAAAALATWFLLPQSNVLLILIFTVVAAGTVAYLPAFWALPSAFLSSSAAAAAVGFINCTASIGGFFGPKLVGHLSQTTGSFNPAFLFMIACWTIASVLVLLCPRATPDTRASLREW
jgi:sugar phosphate permease